MCAPGPRDAPAGAIAPPPPWPMLLCRAGPPAALRWLSAELYRRQDAVPAARRAAGSVTPPAVDRAVAHDVALVVTELVDNAVRHGRGARLELEVVLLRGLLRVVVVSWGEPFRVPDGLPPPEATSGRGLCVVGAVCRRWGVAHQGGRNEVWAELTVP